MSSHRAGRDPDCRSAGQTPNQDHPTAGSSHHMVGLSRWPTAGRFHPPFCSICWVRAHPSALPSMVKCFYLVVGLARTTVGLGMGDHPVLRNRRRTASWVTGIPLLLRASSLSQHLPVPSPSPPYPGSRTLAAALRCHLQRMTDGREWPLCVAIRPCQFWPPLIRAARPAMLGKLLGWHKLATLSPPLSLSHSQA